MGNSNTIQKSYIGTDITGTGALGNGTHGVEISAAGKQNLIERNIISGNLGNGILLIDDGVEGNVIKGNLIGTDATGTIPIGNAGHGVSVQGANENLIGGIIEFDRNIISGNVGHGVEIVGLSATNNFVTGNFIGTDITGVSQLANAGSGVAVGGGAQSNAIGMGIIEVEGDETAYGTVNVISGNFGHGVIISDQGSDGNLVAGNYIGTDASGQASIANQEWGVGIWNSAKGNRVGTDSNDIGDEDERNVISGNQLDGVIIFGAHENVVAGNLIGTTLTGDGVLGNGEAGIEIADGTKSNIVGMGNTISGNKAEGILIIGTDTAFNRVSGNYIGTDVAGVAPLSNLSSGLSIVDGAHHNVIGTNGDGIADAVERNIISGNTLDGVILSFEAYDNVLAGNFIGTDVTGTQPLPNAQGTGIPNHRGGIEISNGARRNRIGTNGDSVSDASERNTISGNIGNGITIFDDVVTGTDENIIAGNYVGTDASGLADLGNGGQGISIRSSRNTVGGQSQSQGNTIAFNGGAGVAVHGGLENAINHNSFFFNSEVGIDLGADGWTLNDPGDMDSGPNRLQNFPEFSGALALNAGIVEFTYAVPSIIGNSAYPIHVEFYRADADQEEGEIFVAADTFTNIDWATGSKSVSVPVNMILTGEYIVATATDNDGNSSEFSDAVHVVPLIIGDFTGDRIVDAEDINTLFAAIRAGVPAAEFDLDGSDEIDQADVEFLVENILGTFMGDATLDGKVDSADLNQVGIHWRAAIVAGWQSGDFNGDGNVDPADLNSVGLNWLGGVAAAAFAPAKQRIPRAPLPSVAESTPILAVDKVFEKESDTELPPDGRSKSPPFHGTEWETPPSTGLDVSHRSLRWRGNRIARSSDGNNRSFHKNREDIKRHLVDEVLSRVGAKSSPRPPVGSICSVRRLAVGQTGVGRVVADFLTAMRPNVLPKGHGPSQTRTLKLLARQRLKSDSSTEPSRSASPRRYEFPNSRLIDPASANHCVKSKPSTKPSSVTSKTGVLLPATIASTRASKTT